MRRMTGLMTIGAAACLGTIVLAQTSTSTVPRNARSADPITVTGCIERADQISQTGTQSTTVDSLTFVLIKTIAPTSAQSATSATAGTTGTSGATDKTTLAGRLYRLDARTETLNPHVGHKVELTGTIVEPGAARPDPADPMPGAPKMRVDGVKMIAPTCSR